MNSQERLKAVLTGQIPDRVPISTYELCGYNSQAFENNDPSYAKMMESIREKTDCICMWNPGSNATFLESSYPVKTEVEQKREGDFTVTHTVFHTPKGDIKQTIKVMDNVHTTWQTEHLCKNTDDVDKVLSVPYEPVSYDASDFTRIKEEVGENGIIMASLCDPLGAAAPLMDFGAYTVWAMTETEHFARTIAGIWERMRENLRRMLEANVSDLYRICGPEYAAPPYLPPRFFQRFVVPYVTEMIGLIHQKGSKARLHCHGRIRKVLDMILDTGADGIDPCEAPPDGDITLAEIRERTGSQVCLFGNLQLKLLEQGTEKEVETAVKECMSAAKEGGGYVIMPTAAPINSPLAEKTEKNYLRFIETALEYGKY